MPRLIAKQDLRYAGRDLKAGNEFEAHTAGDARVLHATGKADYAAAGAMPTVDANPTPSAQEGQQQARRGRYNRRDMRARD